MRKTAALALLMAATMPTGGNCELLPASRGRDRTNRPYVPSPPKPKVSKLARRIQRRQRKRR